MNNSAGYSGKNPRNRGREAGAEMPVVPNREQTAEAPQGERPMPALTDSNYGHNRGVKFAMEATNHAWKGNQIPEPDQVT